MKVKLNILFKGANSVPRYLQHFFLILGQMCTVYRIVKTYHCYRCGQAQVSRNLDHFFLPKPISLSFAQFMRDWIKYDKRLKKKNPIH